MAHGSGIDGAQRGLEVNGINLEIIARDERDAAQKRHQRVPRDDFPLLALNLVHKRALLRHYVAGPVVHAADHARTLVVLVLLLRGALLLFLLVVLRPARNPAENHRGKIAEAQAVVGGGDARHGFRGGGAARGGLDEGLVLEGLDERALVLERHGGHLADEVVGEARDGEVVPREQRDELRENGRVGRVEGEPLQDLPNLPKRPGLRLHVVQNALQLRTQIIPILLEILPLLPHARHQVRVRPAPRRHRPVVLPKRANRGPVPPPRIRPVHAARRHRRRPLLRRARLPRRGRGRGRARAREAARWRTMPRPRRTRRGRRTRRWGRRS
mmetsp:Transcript_11687/g.29544  ORF Transcript_11687/g.29544 Transcript_11687/m.29544 type:complete len:328 (-) Transcript_11687:462-1445(-)